jgi:two-component system, OmpR family, phosphate regulon sensor histidine kinase PhoR
MGLAQWFWRLFFIFAGLIAAHVVVVTILVARLPNQTPLALLWLLAGITIALGAAATWFCMRQVAEPLKELSRHVRSLTLGEAGQRPSLNPTDEVGVLAGAFDQMQRDLARRLSQIQDHSQHLQSVLSSMAEGVLAVAPDKTILLANEAARRLLDFAAAQALNRPLVEATRARPVHEAVEQALMTTFPIIREFEAPGPTRRTLSLRADRLTGEPCPGVMIVLHDMTELRRLENLRREFVANVSHELKTPLAAIKGYAETLRLGAINDAEHNLHFVRRIEEQADRLYELILDLLQIARLESGEELFELTNVDIPWLLEQCRQQFAEVAAGKQVQLRVELPESRVTAKADEEGVRTIVNNLIDNGLKYTPSGGSVVIRATADKSMVLLEVQDTGIGIAEKDLARIFERFYRVDRARSRELGGTGLGLSIVQHLARAFGGDVSVESQPGHGSTFRVRIPRVT